MVMSDSSKEMLPLAASLSHDEWQTLCAGLGAPRYRAEQIWHWIHCKGVNDWGAMLNVPKALREALAERFVFPSVALLDVVGSEKGTRKLLLGLRDGEKIETVIIPAGGRRTVCVSSQAGCAYGCAFCASGMRGLIRDLSVGEIVGQVMQIRELDGKSPTHVVLMGIGEPLANYEAVLAAVRALNHPKGLAIGIRRMTISTCGLVPGIERLADEGMQVELSVSLHAPDDELRDELVPVNRRYPIADLLDACDRYTKQTKRIVTYEYTLVRDLNDTPEHADALADLLSGHHCRVNLIPLSPVDEFDGRPPRMGVPGMFTDTLMDAGINTTLRQSRGRNVDAACGQLRLRSDPEGDEMKFAEEEEECL